MSTIDDDARDLLDKVLKAYEENPNLTMSEILDSYLAPFNDKTATALNNTIIDMMGSDMTSTLAAVPLTPAALSSSLYNNAKDAALSTTKVLNDHLTTGASLEELRAALYDGYGYEELLDIKKKLPKYISDSLTESKISRLKTGPLRSSYLDVLNAKNDKELKKAMKVALEEKARYYANRIAVTEEARAFTLANADRQIKAGVKFVKWRLSSLHKTTCICEFFARQNVGYGPGIYPLLSAPAPVYSTHPHCKCSLRDYHRTPTYNQILDPSRKALEAFSDWEQRQILGSGRKQLDWLAGSDMMAVVNKSKRGFPSQTIGDLFNKSVVDEFKSIFDPTVAMQNSQLKATIEGWTGSTVTDTRALYYNPGSSMFTSKKTILDDMFKTYTPNANPTVAYRGLSFDTIDGTIDNIHFDRLMNLDVGDIYNDIAPASWTSSSNIADIYARAGDSNVASVLLKVPKGLKPIGYDIEAFSSYALEAEILVAPGTQLVVKTTDLIDGVLTIVMEVK